MGQVIEKLILDFQERKLPDLTRRRIAMPRLEGKVDSVVGMRRSGKTWFVYQTIGDLLTAGADPRSVVYINFEDDRLWPLEPKDLGKLADDYYRLYPQMRQETVSFFFDEIQEIFLFIILEFQF